MPTRINDLLDKYWEGESTLEEEKELVSYFTSGHVSQELEVYKPMFQFFESRQAITYTQPDPTLIIEKAARQPGILHLSTFRKVIFAVAAVFFLVLASWFVFRVNDPQTESMANVHEIEDPEEAYRVTMEALALVSGKLNKGTESISLGLQNVNKANIFK